MPPLKPVIPPESILRGGCSFLSPFFHSPHSKERRRAYLRVSKPRRPGLRAAPANRPQDGCGLEVRPETLICSPPPEGSSTGLVAPSACHAFDNVSIKRGQSELVRSAEREKRRVKLNVSIKREQSELVRFSEREKRGVKPNYFPPLPHALKQPTPNFAL